MVSICDVGPRDGLQIEPVVLPVERRAELVRRLALAGLPLIEVGSFVNPRLVPSMAGTAEVIALLGDEVEGRLTALVMATRGYEELAATSLREFRFLVVATETFNHRNARRSVGESIAEAELVIARAHADGRRAGIILGAAFGCPYEGSVDPGRVRAIAERLAVAGADELILADTIGVAVPAQVRALVAEVEELFETVGVHLHDTRGIGAANALAAVEAGVDVLDSSVGGVGGCPFAPSGSGNVGTEDVVYLLEREGVSTGIDLDAVIETARWLATQLDHGLDGSVHRAGTWFPEEFSQPAGLGPRSKKVSRP